MAGGDMEDARGLLEKLAAPIEARAPDLDSFVAP